MYTVTMMIEVADPATPDRFTQVDQLPVRVRSVSMTGLGAHARDAAELYRAGTNTAGTVRVTLTAAVRPTLNEPRRVSAYAGPAPSADHLSPAQRALLTEAYGAGVVVRPDQHPVANELVHLQLLERAGRVHGAVTGRQFIPVGPVRVDYAVETTQGVIHGHRHLPTADQALLDTVATALAAHHPDAVRASLHTVDPATGQLRTAWTNRLVPVEG